MSAYQTRHNETFDIFIYRIINKIKHFSVKYNGDKYRHQYGSPDCYFEPFFHLLSRSAIYSYHNIGLLHRYFCLYKITADKNIE